VSRLLAAVAALAILAPFAVGRAARPPGVVAVRVSAATGAASRATGVVVAPNRILTVAHVLEGGLGVTVSGGDGRPRTAEALRVDRALDLALLAVPGLDGRRPRIGARDAGLRVLVRRDGRLQARPATLRRRLTARLLDQPGRPRRPSLELDVDVRNGDSGAPVVGGDGRVVGIVYARSTRRARTAYAVRASALRRLLPPGS
jgi:S1-C subfamily serine protease